MTHTSKEKSGYFKPLDSEILRIQRQLAELDNAFSILAILPLQNVSKRRIILGHVFVFDITDKAKFPVRQLKIPLTHALDSGRL